MGSSMGSGAGRRSAGARLRGVPPVAGRRAGTFTDVPTTSHASTSASVTASTAARAGGRVRIVPPLRTVLSARVAAVLAASALVVPPVVLAGGTAYAAPGDGKAPPKAAAPPAKMSHVGGERLSAPGVQVQLKDGAPKLPHGITARSWIVSDAESGEVLAAKNPHWQLPPASTLKMLFADTVLPKFPKSEKYKVKPADLAGMGVGSSLVGIKENLTYSVHDLWLGVFLRSGNDAVHTLSAMNGGTQATVTEMQKHAKELNATDTHVVTPDGYDAPGQVSSAYDLSLFARAGLQNPDFREYCSTASAQFPGDKGKDGKRASFGIQNTNRLLSGDYDIKPYPGIAGVKNGSTTNAGSTFTGVAQRGERKLLVTVMNPEKKEHNEAYKETAQLFDWGFSAAGKVEPVGRLVGPRSEEGDATAAGSGKGADGDGKNGKNGTTRAALEAGDSSGSVWTAVGVTGGVLIVLGAVALGVRHRSRRARG
ncbi:D-alanyl-D-alanine carboxypeptidase family protein [Streptomyces sp. NPDC048644]|uniref:D-alanyl-D-alanine carboxypeptidase family protein n=1 Tax=Streptomyces sp. NPDC048644 TaxID=3365582 RepID=UPI0037156C1D